MRARSHMNAVGTERIASARSGGCGRVGAAAVIHEEASAMHPRRARPPRSKREGPRGGRGGGRDAALLAPSLEEARAVRGRRSAGGSTYRRPAIWMA